MSHSRSFSSKSLVLLLLAALAVTLPSSSLSAPRRRLRCTLTPRVLPANGGTATLRAEAIEGWADSMVAIFVRPDGSTGTKDLDPVGNGRFEATLEMPENSSRRSQRYSVSLAVNAEDGGGVTARCGRILVKPNADAGRVAVSSCSVLPRQFPAEGGEARLEARIIGPRRGLSVVAHISGPGVDEHPRLSAGAGGAYRASFSVPPNSTSEPQVFLVRLSVESATVNRSEVDCGNMIVHPAGAQGRIGVVGIQRGQPLVQILRAGTLEVEDSFTAIGPNFQGSATLAVGDFTGDGVADYITGAGPGALPAVQRVRGSDGGDMGTFLAYSPSFTGGVYVAAGDVNGDGRADIITGAGPGAGPHVKVFDGLTGAELHSFFAYAPGFSGGVRVAVGDVNGDGRADIITSAGAGAGPHVKVFSGTTATLLRSFFAFSPTFTGGVFVAAGDVNGDGRADIITGADAGAGPHVKVFDGRTGREARSFFAFDAAFTGGVRVAAGDFDGDGRADVITGAGPGDGAGAGPHVKVFSGVTGAELRSFLPFDPTYTGGVFVAGWH